LLWPKIRKEAREPKDSSEADVQLAERLKRQDEHAFLILYDRHRRSVYRFLMHMTGSIAAAEELTQEVFVVILDAICAGNFGQFDPEKGTLEGYLLGIARNLAREERRKSHRMVYLEDMLDVSEGNNQLMEPEGRTWDAAQLLVARSEFALLYRAILGLPDHYREVVVLCSLQEKTYQEAAAILQCSEGTIASRMNRAKALLSAKLRRSAPDEANLNAI
jgi:RNA polymerase sigma-70 factor, ECF subfamily